MASPTTPPPAGTLEAWAFEVIQSPTLAGKLEPGGPPRALEVQPPPRADLEPSRPLPLEVVARAPKTPRAGALVRAEARAKLLHTFFHHELQAAELFAWALLAFPDAPEAFRRGLAAIADEELRHARMYAEGVRALGSELGAFPVRDWFWERFTACTSPLAFVALMGLGFEGGNLDHGTLWAERLRSAGDEASARIVDAVARDEVRHVAFAVRWFREWTGGLDFDVWRAALPAPLTPTVMRGPELDLELRRLAGLDETFLEELAAWDRAAPGC